MTSYLILFYILLIILIIFIIMYLLNYNQDIVYSQEYINPYNIIKFNNL